MPKKAQRAIGDTDWVQRSFHPPSGLIIQVLSAQPSIDLDTGTKLRASGTCSRRSGSQAQCVQVFLVCVSAEE